MMTKHKIERDGVFDSPLSWTLTQELGYWEPMIIPGFH